MIALITAALGIIGTVVAWNLNPKRRLYAELDSIYKQLDVEYKRRDDALVKNDSDGLTVATANIVKLCERKAVLFQRLR